MGFTRTAYNELSRAEVSSSRNVVISECSRGGFTIAQQLEITEDGKPMTVFLKGAIHVDNVDGLLSMRDAINAALDKSDKIQASKYANDWQ